MHGLHPALRADNAAAAADRCARPARPVAPTTPVDRAALVVALEAFARHVRDANDLLGHRASGLSLAAAARKLDEDVLAPITRMVRHGEGEPPAPHEVRTARTALRDASLELRDLSRAALDLVPPDAAEQQRLDLQLCAWGDAAQLLARWVSERVGR